MNTPLDVIEASQKIVSEWLSSSSSSVVLMHTNIPNLAYIQVTTAKGIKLIQVLSSLYPNEPPMLSKQEENQLKQQAQILGAHSWEARLQLNNKGQLHGEIKWREV
jgi:hypothetical protein